jgi:hypothetical protein
MTKTKKTDEQPETTKAPSKLDQLVTLLNQPGGVDLATMMTATGWQAHSVRGALAGSLRKKGHQIISEKVDGLRTWRIEEQAAA